MLSFMDAMTEIATPDPEGEMEYAIGDRASTLRRRAGLTLVECGRIIGVTESSASLKFNGKGKWSAWEVHEMAATLGVTVSVLYGDEPMPEPTRPATVTTLDVSRNIEKELRSDNSHRAIVTQIFRPATSKLTGAA